MRRLGYPIDAATAIAVREVRQCLARATPVQHVVFACFSEEVRAAYARELARP